MRRTRERMLVRGLLIEVYRNLVARRAASVILAAVAAACGIGVAVGSWVVADAATDAWDRQLSRGASAFVVSSSLPGVMDARRCDELQGVSGVRAAGAVLASTTGSFASSPDARVAIMEVTPGYVRAVFPSATAALDGVAIGARVAQNNGVLPGAYLRLLDGSQSAMPVAVVDDGMAQRINGIDNAVLVPKPAVGVVDQCLVEAQPGAAKSVEELLVTWFPPEYNWTIVPLLTAPEFEIDAVRMMRDSPVPLLAAGAALVTGLLMWAILWSRRQDLALYRLLGVGTRAIVAMIWLEWAAVVLAPASLGVAIGFGFFGNGDILAEFRAYLVFPLCVYLVGLTVIPPVAHVLLVIAKPVDILKGA